MKLSPHNIVLLFKLIVFLFIMYSTHVTKEELVVESLRDLMQLEESRFLIDLNQIFIKAW